MVLGVSAMGSDVIEPKWGTTKEINYAFGIMGRRNLSANWALRANLLHTTLTGNDRWSEILRDRGFSTRVPTTELSVDLQWDILGHRRLADGSFRAGLSPYLMAGIGLAFANPDPTFNYQNGSLQRRIEQDKNADIKGPHLVVPVGLGLRWYIAPSWAIAWEVAPRGVTTDYLDGISISGNPDEKDGYGFVSMQLWYRFGTSSAADQTAGSGQ